MREKLLSQLIRPQPLRGREKVRRRLLLLAATTDREQHDHQDSDEQEYAGDDDGQRCVDSGSRELVRVGVRGVTGKHGGDRRTR